VNEWPERSARDHVAHVRQLPLELEHAAAAMPRHVQRRDAAGEQRDRQHRDERQRRDAQHQRGGRAQRAAQHDQLGDRPVEAGLLQHQIERLYARHAQQQPVERLRLVEHALLQDRHPLLLPLPPADIARKRDSIRRAALPCRAFHH
jgi:hypothetical protein